MAADFRLIAHAAKSDADELTSECTGDRFAQRRLADAGRTDQGQNRAATSPVTGVSALGLEFAHGQVLQDPLLDVRSPS